MSGLAIASHGWSGNETAILFITHSWTVVWVCLVVRPLFMLILAFRKQTPEGLKIWTIWQLLRWSLQLQDLFHWTLVGISGKCHLCHLCHLCHFDFKKCYMLFSVFYIPSIHSCTTGFTDDAGSDFAIGFCWPCCSTSVTGGFAAFQVFLETSSIGNYLRIELD